MLVNNTVKVLLKRIELPKKSYNEKLTKTFQFYKGGVMQMEGENIETTWQSFNSLTTKNVKDDSTQETFNRVVFEGLQRWALSSDSDSDFNTHCEQIKSKKSRNGSTKVEWSFKNQKINNDLHVKMK